MPEDTTAILSKLADSLGSFAETQRKLMENRNHDETSLKEVISLQFKNVQQQLDGIKETLKNDGSRHDTERDELWKAIEHLREDSRHTNTQISKFQGIFVVGSVLIGGAITVATTLILRGLGAS